MSYDNNWSGGGARDKGLKDVAIIAVLLGFVLFGLVIYFVYQQVSDLSEKTGVLVERIAALESRLEQPSTQEPAYVEKWTPVATQEAADPKTDTKKHSQKGPFIDFSSVKPKAVDTLSVRPDGTMIDTPKSPKLEGSGKAANVKTVRVKTVERNKTVLHGATQSEKRRSSTPHDDIDVEVRTCVREQQYVSCDLRVVTSVEEVRTIKISNRETFIVDYANGAYRVSSFQIGLTGDKQRFRANAPISRALPLDLRFQFYQAPNNMPVVKSAQFNIGGQTFAFQNLMVEKAKQVDGANEAYTRRVLADTGEVNTSPPNGLRKHNVRTNGIGVDLLKCGARKNRVFCDLKLINLERSGRRVVVSKDKSFARSRQNTARRFTSFSLNSSDKKHLYHATVFLKKSAPQMVRFHLYAHEPDVAEYKSMQFNINGQRVVFENVAIGDWSSTAASSP